MRVASRLRCGEKKQKINSSLANHTTEAYCASLLGVWAASGNHKRQVAIINEPRHGGKQETVFRKNVSEETVKRTEK